MTPQETAVAIVALNEGRLVGRTRLQKTAYLLDQCGMRSRLSYQYHYYGPYSFELADGWATAESAGHLKLESKPGRHGVPYTVFITPHSPPAKLGALPAARAKEILARLAKEPDVVLELAATLRFFANRPDVDDPEAEVRRRKPVKSTPGKLAAARTLLNDLGLPAGGGPSLSARSGEPARH